MILCFSQGFFCHIDIIQGVFFAYNSFNNALHRPLWNSKNECWVWSPRASQNLQASGKGSMISQHKQISKSKTNITAKNLIVTWVEHNRETGYIVVLLTMTGWMTNCCLLSSLKLLQTYWTNKATLLSLNFLISAKWRWWWSEQFAWVVLWMKLGTTKWLSWKSPISA